MTLLNTTFASMPSLLKGDALTSHVLAATALTAVVAASYYTYCCSLSKPKQPQCAGMEKIPLLPSETCTAMFQINHDISTLTWYLGDSVPLAETKIRDRLGQMIKANPWLKGRLVQAGSDISLVYTKSGDNSVDESIFRLIPKGSSTVSRDTPYEQLPKLLSDLGCSVGRGVDIVNKDESFFRVCILPDAKQPNKRFALVVSLAHCVGDGHTFYSLHNMLDSGTDITALNPVRKPDIPDRITNALGGRDKAGSVEDPPIGFILRFLKGVFLSSLLGPPAKVKLFWISDDWIQKEKKLAKLDDPKVKFVSTNDIVTARFFQISQTDQGIMALNFRGKVAGCNETDAGNYYSSLICRPEDYQSPTRIRRTLDDVCAGQRQSMTSPMNSWDHIVSNRLFATVSNWTSFCRPIKLDDCTQDLHVPVLPCDPVSRAMTCLFLFQPAASVAGDGKNKIAAMFMGHPRVLADLEKLGMVGPNVY